MEFNYQYFIFVIFILNMTCMYKINLKGLYMIRDLCGFLKHNTGNLILGISKIFTDVLVHAFLTIIA